MGQSPNGAKGESSRDIQNVLTNTLYVRHDIGVRHSDRGESMGGHNGVALRICFVIVRVTVDLDDQAEGRAKEVHDTHAEHRLASEFEAAELTVRPAAPKALFRFGRFSAHLVRTSCQPGPPPQPLP
ncbi:hypothetical protein GGQ80_001662 [Sphingomonas jinjuensis]|uniref:Uncharacterized protein n=1 Tax=Sphingomonas jinjuensis TaxID=535907 RepID=A0A840FBY7_9SPHN|nr:hypothetical protein [Sphingomonas jinjuensis]